MDLKEETGLEHIPSGQYYAKRARLAHVVLANSLICQINHLGEITPKESTFAAQILRAHFISMKGRSIDRSGKMAPLTPARGQWAIVFLRVLRTLHSLETVLISQTHLALRLSH